MEYPIWDGAFGGPVVMCLAMAVVQVVDGFLLLMVRKVQASPASGSEAA